MKGALASAAIVMLLVLWYADGKMMIITGTIIAIVMMMLMAFVCFVVTWIDFKIKDRELRRKNKKDETLMQK